MKPVRKSASPPSPFTVVRWTTFGSPPPPFLPSNCATRRGGCSHTLPPKGPTPGSENFAQNVGLCVCWEGEGLYCILQKYNLCRSVATKKFFRIVSSESKNHNRRDELEQGDISTPLQCCSKPHVFLMETLKSRKNLHRKLLHEKYEHFHRLKHWHIKDRLGENQQHVQHAYDISNKKNVTKK